MRRQLRARFWVATTLGTLSAGLFILTLVWRDWIERILDVEPDAGSGSLEWAIVGATALAAVGLGLLARAEWRRAAPAL